MARAFRVSADEPSRRQPFGLISSLVGLVPQYPPRPDAGDRVLAAVEDLCGVGQLVLCADDLHHADGDSLRVLTQLVESTRDLPLTLILARRPLPVRDQLVSLAARPKVLAAEVVPMDRAGLADLVRRAWGTAADASLLDQLAVTGGNPFPRRGAARAVPADGAGRRSSRNGEGPVRSCREDDRGGDPQSARPAGRPGA